MDYNKTAIIRFSFTASGSAGLHSQYGFPNQFMIKRAWLVVRVQGAQATGGLRFETADGGTTIATLTAGTAAVGTVVSADVSEDNRYFDAGSAVRIENIITDASGVYDVYFLVGHAE
jgi:hypothetical protein